MLVLKEKGHSELPEKNLSEKGRRSVDVGLEPRPHQSRKQSLLAGGNPTDQKARRLCLRDCGHIGVLQEISTLRHP